MTTGRSILFAVLLVLICMAAPPSHGQQTSAPEGVIRINVNLVQVDAIVTDSKGKPVTNLTADDFEVFQDGKPQNITNFSFINVKDAKVTTVTPATKARPAKGLPLPLPPPPPPRADQIRRTIALVVDDLALSADSVVRVRQSLKKWVDTEMRPGDLVAVIRTSAGMGALQQFSVDRRMLYAAIDLIQFHLGRVGVESFAPLTGAALSTNNSPELDTTLFNNEVEQSYMLGSMGAIQYVLTGLRELPGRKSLILFSENLKFTYLDRRDLVNVEETSRGVVEEKLRRLIDEANRSSVVVYAMDPRGVAYTGLTASDFSGSAGGDSAGLSPQEISQTDTKRMNDLIASQDGMILLTQKTGGEFLHNNDIQGSLRQLVDDGDGYYLLGYQPDFLTFEGSAKQPKFHTIRVRVKRPGLTVRSRSGFFGTPDGQAPAPVGRAAQMLKAMGSPFATGDVRVKLTTLFSHSEREGAYINALFHFDARDLQFTKDPGGAQSAQVDTFAATFDTDGRPVDTADKAWSIRLEQGSYEDVLKRGLVYSIRVPVKKPGAYQMRVVLRDSTSEKIGSATQFIEVPDLLTGRLALSSVALSAEQSRAANGVPPVEAPSKSEDDPNWSPAVRVFKSGAAIIYAYQIMNARVGGDKKTQLQVQTRLFREGQQVYSGSPIALSGEGAQDPKHLVGTGRIELAKAAPGHYVLQVIVADRLAKEKYRLAAQSVDFDVAE